VDILHVQSIFTARKDVAPFALMRLKPFKVVYTAHNVLPHDEEERTALGMVTAFRFLYLCSDAIVTHTRGDREELIRKFGVPSEKISAIPHGNFDFLTGGSGITGADVRQQFNIAPDELLILVFGAIRRYKGIHMLIEAFSRLSGRYPNARLLIVGNRTDPGYADELEQLIDDRSLQGRARLHGTYIDTEDLAGYFDASDCIALPYEHIYDSGVLRLALSAAKPVLATRVGVFAEIIRDGEHGFLVDPTADDLAAGLERVLETSPNELTTMGSKARSAFEEEHSWQRIAAETAGIYRSLIPSSTGSANP
jgi:glycosyltransferase involved in cell wall biosynthesis